MLFIKKRTSKANQENFNSSLTNRSTISTIVLKAFCIIFCFLFTIVIGSVIFANSTYDLSPAILMVLITIILLSLFLLQRIMDKHVGFFNKHYIFIIASGLILLFVVNIIMGYNLRFDPTFDLDAIFTGAKEWATTGSFLDYMNETGRPDYFYYFPNNLGGMTLLFLVFKAVSLFGVTDYFAIAMIMNTLLMITTVLLIVLICKRLFGITQSIMALLCVLLMPPFYFIGPVFYTDSLSMVFPVLVFYLYLKYTDSTTNKKKITFAALIGIGCAIGMLIKFTVLIALIVIVIYQICTKGFMSVLPIVAISGIVITVVLVVFNSCLYTPSLLDKNSAEQAKIPYSHWIMMSLEGDGGYNPQDYEFTFSFNDKEEQKAAIADRIEERIENRGLLGILCLFHKKSITIFGDGTLAQSDFLDDNPVNDTDIHSFVLYNGEYYQMYQHICSGIYFALQILMLVSAYGFLRNKTSCETLIPLLCMFGVLLFFMIWEVSGRYITNYIPMLIILAISGLNVIKEKLYSRGL